MDHCYIVRITKWDGEAVEAEDNPRWYGTVSYNDQNPWPGFLGLDGFETWPEDYDTDHTPVPNKTNFERIGLGDLPPAIKAMSQDGGWSVRDHLQRMLGG